jgi:hypothetical protein
MDKRRPLLNRLTPKFPRSSIAIAVVVILVVVLLLLVPKTQEAPEQPIAFNHQIMVQLGIDCLFCHVDAIRSPAAGMPSLEKCMGCHKVVATTTPVIQQVTGYWERQEPIPWVRVNQLPRFVYFSHRVHVVGGGFNCERCHGDVGHMTVDKPVVRMDMGWCLGCHEQQTNANQLRDCVVCHQ